MFYLFLIEFMHTFLELKFTLKCWGNVRLLTTVSSSRQVLARFVLAQLQPFRKEVDTVGAVQLILTCQGC